MGSRCPWVAPAMFHGYFDGVVSVLNKYMLLGYSGMELMSAIPFDTL